MSYPKLARICALALIAVVGGSAATRATSAHAAPPAHHVLLISVDGMHASDLAMWVAQHPHSALASLTRGGTTYSRALTAFPSDSFPGMLALATGGTPKSTGVYYDDSYDRTLYAPGTNCTGPAGAEIVYDESIDFDLTKLFSGGINPANLPMQKTASGCAPLYPHSFLGVNTIFDVAHGAGMLTAWSDKHPAYELLNGPSGHGIDELYTPEIAASIGGVNITDEVSLTERYDATKVRALDNEIDGRTPSGKGHRGTPAILGMNFQAVSVAQKLPTGGYVDHGTRFGASLGNAFAFVDRSIGSMVAHLRARHLLSDTEIIVTAKHGQSPIDRSRFREIDPATIPDIVDNVAPDLVAQATQDDVSLLWLSDQSQTAAAVAALEASVQNGNPGGIARIISGAKLRAMFGNPATNPRVPDIVIQPQRGVVYSLSTSKIAEHGGGTMDDRHVGLLVFDGADPSHGTVTSRVHTTQVAPTILDYLGLDPSALRAVRVEHTRPLPAG